MKLKFYRVGNRLMAEVHNPADPGNVAHVEVERVIKNDRIYSQYENQIEAFKLSETQETPKRSWWSWLNV